MLLVANLSAQALQRAESLDDLLLDCEQLHSSSKAALDRLRQESSRIQSELSANVGKRTAAAAGKDQASRAADELKDRLSVATAQCEEKTNDYRDLITKMTEDLRAAVTIQDYAANCTSKPKRVFLQEALCVGKGSDPSIEPIDPMLKSLLANLKTSFARRELQHAMKKVYGGGGGTIDSLVAERYRLSQAAEPLPPVPDGVLPKTTECDYVHTKEVQCGVMSVELRRVLGRLQGQLRDKSLEQRSHEERCRSDRLQQADQLDAYRTTFSEAGQRLANVMAMRTDLDSAREALDAEVAKVESALAENSERCNEEAASLEAQICDIVQLRQVAYEREGGGSPIQDCVVSEWVFSECSKECTEPGGTGGRKQGTREIDTHAGPHGMPCPKTQTSMSCGTGPCPQNCQVSEWSDWAACSKVCGGGTGTRARQVLTEAAHDGDACPVLTETQVCNMGDCDPQCELDDWSGWSACSRVCKYAMDMPVGQQHRLREVKMAPEGEGGCPSENSAKRLQLQACGTELCPSDIRCAGGAPQELVVLLDGSATSNFTAQCQLASQLVERVGNTTRIGLVAYGGNTRVISSMSADRTTLLAALHGAAAPGGDPDLAQGEVLARSLLQSSQLPESRKSVLVLTNGAPTAIYPAEVLAARLREQGAKVLVGLAGGPGFRNHKLENVCKLASSPCAEHVEVFTDWLSMAREPGRLLTAICQRL
jgi:hypothetical protein